MRSVYSLFALLLWMPALWAVDSSNPENSNDYPNAYKGREQTTLTIYNQNFGIVRDQRKVRIQKNPDTIQFDNVAKQIEIASVRFQSLTDPRATVLEQYYEYDLTSPDKLLQKYLNKPLTVSLKNGAHYTGNLLHFDTGALILQEGEKEEKSPSAPLTMIARENNVKDIHFNPNPQVFTEPSLIWNIATDQLGDHWVEASYETAGLNWQADYNALLHREGTIMDLHALVTLSNESGATYQDANLKLIAGETKRTPQPSPMIPMMATAQASFRGQKSAFHEEAFSEYHLYTLDRPITLVNNQTKQISLFETFDVPIKKTFVYEGAPHVYWRGERGEPITDPNYGNEEGNKKVQVRIEFKNSLENHMGMPLPQGTVRLYQKNPTDGAFEFIGEDIITHTPKNKKVRLTMGYAFDIVGRRKRMDFQVDVGRHIMTESFEIELQNHGDSPIEVLVKEPLYRWNSWEIVSSSIPYEKYDANTIQFHVPVERDGKQALIYTVRYTW